MPVSGLVVTLSEDDGFQQETIDAIVAEAQFTDSGAADYLAQTLWDRRVRVGRAWLGCTRRC